MEMTGKMPARVKRIRFANSQNECEVVLPQTLASGGESSSRAVGEATQSKPKRRRRATSAGEGPSGNEPSETKGPNLTRCSAALVVQACRALSTVHHEKLEEIGLDAVAYKSLESLEQPDLIQWLMDRTDPDTMCISIDDDRKIPITSRTVRLVLGTLLGGNDIVLPSHKVVRTVHKSITDELGIHKKARLSTKQLIEVIKSQKDDSRAIRYFIMVLMSKLLVPTTDFYVPKGDVWVASDLDRVTAIDWSKAVFRAVNDSIRYWRQNPASSIASFVVFLVVLYLDNILPPRDIGLDLTFTPRIQIFTKDIVDKLVAADQEASGDGTPPFGNLPLQALESTCYANKPAGRAKGPMVEDIMASAYNFPNMSTILGPHLAGLPSDQRLVLLESLAEYDRQAKESALEIERQFRLVVDKQHMLCQSVIDVLQANRAAQPPPVVPQAAQCQEASRRQSDVQFTSAEINPNDSEDQQQQQHHGCNGSPSVFDQHTIHPNAPTHVSPSMEIVPYIPPVRLEVADQPHLGSAHSPDLTQRSPIPTDSAPLTSEEVSAQYSAPDTAEEPLAIEVGGVIGNVPGVSTAIQTEDAPRAVDQESHGTELLAETNEDTDDANSTPWSQPKRFIQKPARFVSPVVVGPSIMPSDVSLSVQLRDFLLTNGGCMDMSVFITTLIMYLCVKLLEIDSSVAYGNDELKSFSNGNLTEWLFIDAFSSILFKDDMRNMPDTFGKRIFFPTSVSYLLNSNFIKINGETHDFSPDALAENLRDYIQNVQTTKAQMIIVPVLHHNHWSLYAINIAHGRVDIMDSNNYNLIGTLESDHHCALSKRIVKRLSNALHEIAPKSFCRFGGFRKNMMKCPKVQICSNDCAFYIMRFMEAYDGNRESIETFSIPVTTSITP
uniref:Ubiquitin-like protease family profile domain-containing protein n=1 Tax=Oryza barthii TaxID=65489 RepID=A0A0D3HKS0_9ORYZ